MLILKRNNIFLFLTILFALSSCKKHSEKIDFNDWAKYMDKTVFLKFDTNKNIFFYDGSLINNNKLVGTLYEKGNQVFFKSDYPNKLNFVLFDFGLKKEDCIDVEYQKNKKLKKYVLCNKDIFYDRKISDTIYKFYFKNYEVLNKDTGLMVFVSKKRGVLGNYFLDTTQSESNPLIHEKMFGNVYEERYDYTKLTKFTIE